MKGRASIGHAEQDRALLAVSLALVDPFNGECIVEGEGGLLEAHAMIAEILSRPSAPPAELLQEGRATGLGLGLSFCDSGHP